MNDHTQMPASGWRFSLPFLLGDLLLLVAALLIYLQARRPMTPVETSAFAVCVICGAFVGVWPFVLRNGAALKQYEVSELTTTLSQIQRSEEVAQCITNATGQWHAIQEQTASTLAAAREIVENMVNTQKEFRAFFDRAADAERNNLRLEVTKLRRAEGDWIQALVRILDHVYALYSAGVRSGQSNLIEQFGNFQNACRDAARRVGLVPVSVSPGTPFSPEHHQLLNPDAAAPGGATVAEMLATGYAFQGQLLRRPLVVLDAPAHVTSPTTAVVESFSSLPPSQEQVAAPTAHSGEERAPELSQGPVITPGEQQDEPTAQPNGLDNPPHPTGDTDATRAEDAQSG